MAEAAVDRSSILELVNRTLELPALPEVLIKLNQIVAEPDAAADDVAKVICADPLVSAQVLRIVNSAYYGLQVRVSSINLAVSIMGFSMTRKVALKAAVFSTFTRRNRNICRHFDASGFWQHSIFTGVAAKVLGAQSGRFRDHHGEDLYICGLLHDIGKLILLENKEQQALEVLEQTSRSGRPELDVETEVLGFNHADVGSALATRWFLPEELAIAIRHHDAPGEDPLQGSMSALIHLADGLAWSASYPSPANQKPPELDVDVYDRIGLDPEAVEGLRPQIHEDFDHTGMPW